MFQGVKFESKAVILRSVAYVVRCFIKVFDFGQTYFVFVKMGTYKDPIGAYGGFFSQTLVPPVSRHQLFS